MSTNIEWTDRVWNPVTGCAKVSAGCKNCYAEGVANRFFASQYPDVEVESNGPAGCYTRSRQFTDVMTHNDRLTQPLSWKKPCKVFVNSMSDLFHADVPFEFIDQVFAVMALTPHITYQILTKRPERMREYWAADRWNIVEQAIEIVSDEKGDVAGRLLREQFETDPSKYPLPNVWPGVSVEDQETANKRIPELLNTPAAKRFVSYEPALGPVDFSAFMPKPMFYCARCGEEKMRNYCRKCGTEDNSCTNNIIGLDWLIVGGESGPGARPFDIEWARSTVRQCWAAGVPVFVKQLGSVACSADNSTYVGNEITQRLDARMKLKDRKGGDPSEWPEDLRVREFPAVSR